MELARLNSCQKFIVSKESSRTHFLSPRLQLRESARMQQMLKTGLVDAEKTDCIASGIINDKYLLFCI